MRKLGYLCLCPFANSFATIRGSYNTVLQQIPTESRTNYSHDPRAAMVRLSMDFRPTDGVEGASMIVSFQSAS